MDFPAPPTHEDESRHLICQMAIEGHIRAVVDAAIKAGWREADVLAAVIEVADNLMLAAGEISALDSLLLEMKRRRGQADGE